jgi:hypothetical protein
VVFQNFHYNDSSLYFYSITYIWREINSFFIWWNLISYPNCIFSLFFFCYLNTFLILTSERTSGHYVWREEVGDKS